MGIRNEWFVPCSLHNTRWSHLLHLKLRKTALSLLAFRWWALCLGTELTWTARSWKIVSLNSHATGRAESRRSPLGPAFCGRSPQHSLIHVRKCVPMGENWLWTARPRPHQQYGTYFESHFYPQIYWLDWRWMGHSPVMIQSLTSFRTFWSVLET